MASLATRKDNKSLDEFSYNDDIIAGEIYSAMNATQFLGVSVINSKIDLLHGREWNHLFNCINLFIQGTVAFSSKGDRIAWTLVEQMINGTYNKVGYYDTQTDNLTWLTPARWIGDKIPQDRTIIIGNNIYFISIGNIWKIFRKPNW